MGVRNKYHTPGFSLIDILQSKIDQKWQNVKCLYYFTTCYQGPSLVETVFRGLFTNSENGFVWFLKVKRLPPPCGTLACRNNQNNLSAQLYTFIDLHVVHHCIFDGQCFNWHKQCLIESIQNQNLTLIKFMDKLHEKKMIRQTERTTT